MYVDKCTVSRYDILPLAAAFIGMTSGVAVCLCFGILLVCMKRRNYVQFGGPTWAPSSTPATMVSSSANVG